MNVSRNDPCPCGSGKKYKKCCLIAPTTQAAGSTTRDDLDAAPPAGSPHEHLHDAECSICGKSGHVVQDGRPIMEETTPAAKADRERWTEFWDRFADADIRDLQFCGDRREACRGLSQDSTP